MYIHAKNYPLKDKARYAYNNAVRSGLVTRATKCERCDSTDYVEAHHHDYAKPLEVHYLCRRCQCRLHRLPMVIPPRPPNPFERASSAA